MAFQHPPPPSQSPLVVRTLVTSSAEEREQVLRDVEYNVFAFPAALVSCDFMSDSGTSSMTDVQWAAMFRGDESYGRNSGYYCLLDAFRDTFERDQGKQQRVYRDILSGSLDSSYIRQKFLQPQEGGFVNGGPFQLARPNFFITPQGRCAEAILFASMRELIPPRASDVESSSPVIISNGFFDTTGANASAAGFHLQTFLQPGLRDNFPDQLVGQTNYFKGNLDIATTETYLAQNAAALIIMTITNNFAGAQPVSMRNIREAAALSRRYGVPIFFDACRFAENAKFIKDYESGYSSRSVPSIIQEMFTHVDGFTISLKKDGLSNMGGAVCFRDNGLFAQKYESIGMRMKERQILCYGNDSYGGMSGRDLLAAAVGLYEVVKEPFLGQRIGQVQAFAQKLRKQNVPVLMPPGGHAVYLDMVDFFDGTRQPEDFASVGFTVKLLGEYGIRSCEAGPFAWEYDKKSEAERESIPNLVRFAVPRNAMTDAHIDYSVAAISTLYKQRDTIPNIKVSRGADLRLRHFQSGFVPVPLSVPSCPKQTSTRTYYSAVAKQMSKLCPLLSIPAAASTALVNALDLGTSSWGNELVPHKPVGRLSDVGLNAFPVEYSVALNVTSGASQARFLIEAQPPAGVQATPEALRAAAIDLTDAVEQTYGDKVSLARYREIQNLFLPPGGCAGRLAAWHSACVSSSGKLEWKLYLDPRARGQANATSLTKEALYRLGLPDAFSTLEKIMTSGDEILYFALDLHASGHARVKVYVRHPPSATAFQIADKFAVCPATHRDDLLRFLSVMAGGSLGPYEDKAVISCFAFTPTTQKTPAGTVHFPVSAYASHDGEIQMRVEGFIKDTTKNLHDKTIGAVTKDKYARALQALTTRPLDTRTGLHSYVSLKNVQPGPTMTFYLTAELWGVEIDESRSPGLKRADSGVDLAELVDLKRI